MFRHGRIRHLPPPCRLGGVPVHHDPVDGICTNPGNREWGPSPLSFFVVCAYPIHRVMVNWDPPISQVIHLPGTIQKGNTSMIRIVDLVIFAHVAQARVGEENFQYSKQHTVHSITCTVNCTVATMTYCTVSHYYGINLLSAPCQLDNIVQLATSPPPPLPFLSEHPSAPCFPISSPRIPPTHPARLPSRPSVLDWRHFFIIVPHIEAGHAAESRWTLVHIHT